MSRPLLVVSVALAFGCSTLTRPGEELRPDLPIVAPTPKVALAQPKPPPVVTAAITNLPTIAGNSEEAAPPPQPAAKGG